MKSGTVKFYSERKGWGFITNDDGSSDTFVHVSAVEKSNLQSLKDGQRVSFELEPDRKGRLCASQIKVVA